MDRVISGLGFLRLASYLLIVSLAPSVGFSEYSGSRRLEISSLNPEPISSNPDPNSFTKEQWQRVLLAELETVSQIFELYPNHEIYFMERDAGRLYESAALAAQMLKDQSIAERLHPLYVSRVSAKDPSLKAYLEQERVSFSSLRPIVLVDTGFEGSLVMKIRQVAGNENIQGHFLRNTNNRYPSTQVFGRALGSLSDHELVDSIGWTALVETGVVHWYASVPKYDGALVGYEQKGNRLVPKFENSRGENDGAIDPKLASALSRQTAWFYLKEPGTKEYLEKRRTQWRDLIDTYKKGDSRGFNRKLISLLREETALSEGMVVDAITNFPKIFPNSHVKAHPVLKARVDNRRDALAGDQGSRIYEGKDPRFTVPIGYCTKIFKGLNETWKNPEAIDPSREWTFINRVPAIQNEAW